jgi:hypothetical protein
VFEDGAERDELNLLELTNSLDWVSVCEFESIWEPEKALVIENCKVFEKPPDNAIAMEERNAAVLAILGVLTKKFVEDNSAVNENPNVALNKRDEEKLSVMKGDDILNALLLDSVLESL